MTLISQLSVNVSILFMVGDEGITAKHKVCKDVMLTVNKVISKIRRLPNNYLFPFYCVA